MPLDATRSTGREPNRALWAGGLATAAFVCFLSFSAGGFFAGTTAIAVIALLVVLVVLVSVARRPASGLGLGLGLGLGALGLFALWQLISSRWSHAPGRALLAFDLTLLYVLVLAAAGLTADRPGRLRALVYGICAGIFVTAGAGLLSRTLPHVFPVAPGVSNERLSFPLTYWNALGIMSACGAVLCLGLTGSREERPVVRVLAAGAVPVLAVTVFFTFSRGSIAAAIIGTVLVVVLAPRRHMVAGLLATAPTTAAALVVAYHAGALSTTDPTTGQAVSQGRTVFLVVVVIALVSAALRGLLLRFVDPRLDARAPLSHRTTGAIAGGIAVLVVVGGLAAGGSHRIDHAYHRFVQGSRIADADQRDRLTDPGNNGRIAHWRVALDGYRAHRLHGTGAGTYELTWERLRHEQFDVLNAHSLYLETLSETGIVGLAALVAALLTLLAGLVVRLRGPDRALWATLTAAVVMWILEAGADWIWQMPAASAWVFAVGGAALARAPDRARAAGVRIPGSNARLVAGLALLVVAITPVRMALSQRSLDAAIGALERGDCRTTVSDALSSAEALGSRAEPYELLGYCDARLGFAVLSVTMIDRAIARDPQNWQYRYDLGLVLAAQGRDPGPALAAAQRLNPLNPTVFALRSATRGEGPPTWRRRAARARLLLPGQ